MSESKKKKDSSQKVLKDLFVSHAMIRQETETHVLSIINWLMEKGRISTDDAKSLMFDIAKWTRKNRIDMEHKIDHFVGKTLGFNKITLPKREELISLRKKLNDLMDRADKLDAKLSQGEWPREK